MKQLKAPGLAGPVGLSFAFLGYSAAVLVARAFVALEAHCTQACPEIRIRGFQFHHMYYGIILVALAVTASAFVENLRTKWDSALLLGIGLGLVADEMGLLFLKVSYWSLTSILPILAIGLSLGVAGLYKTLSEGTMDFRILDRADVLTVVSLLLAMAGFVYFDRPAGMVVETMALVSWLSALLLMGTFGRKHLLNIRQGQLKAVP